MTTTYIEIDGAPTHALCQPGQPHSPVLRIECRAAFSPVPEATIAARSIQAFQAQRVTPPDWKGLIKPVIGEVWGKIRPGCLTIPDAVSVYSRGLHDVFRGSEYQNLCMAARILRGLGVSLADLLSYIDIEWTLTTNGLGTPGTPEAQAMALLLADDLFRSRLPAPYSTMTPAALVSLIWNKTPDSYALCCAINADTMQTMARSCATILHSAGFDGPWCIAGHSGIGGFEDENGATEQAVPLADGQFSHVGMYGRGGKPPPILMGRACNASRTLSAPRNLDTFDTLTPSAPFAMHFDLTDDGPEQVGAMIRYAKPAIAIVWGRDSGELVKLAALAAQIGG